MRYCVVYLLCWLADALEAVELRGAVLDWLDRLIDKLR